MSSSFDPESASPPIEHVILLVPGIRDYGGWQERAKQLISKEPGMHAVRVSFGYFDAVSFVSPFSKVTKPYEAFLSAYESSREKYSNARISIVAHSFGTYLLGRFLHEHPGAALHRIVLCGSVLREDFPWEEYSDRFGVNLRKEDFAVLNECGNSDKWPARAKSASSRYGAAGRHGFSNDLFAVSRWFNGGHSCFFARRHIAKSWIPFLINGTLPVGSANPPAPSLVERIEATLSGLWMLWFLGIAVLTLLRTFWYVALVVVALAAGAYFMHSNELIVTNRIAMDVAVGRLCSADDTTEFAERLGELDGETIEWRGIVARIEKRTSPCLVFEVVPDNESECKWTIRAHINESTERAKEYQGRTVTFKGKIDDIIHSGGNRIIVARPAVVVRFE